MKTHVNLSKKEFDSSISLTKHKIKDDIKKKGQLLMI